MQLAADIHWLVDNVEWDVEEDLARIIGDTPAHMIGSAARKLAQGLRQFVGARMAKADEATTPAPGAQNNLPVADAEPRQPQ